MTRRSIAAFLLLTVSLHAGACPLETPTYVVGIERYCNEGDVSCDDMLFSLFNRKTGKRFRLNGGTWHRMCADGVTPCRSLGYLFGTRTIRYYAGHDGELTVVKGNKTLSEEQGEWRCGDRPKTEP